MLMNGIKPSRSEIELFEKEFTALRSNIDEKETEEFHKNLIINFLNAVYYKGRHYINTKSRKDLVIHHDNSTSSPVGVLIETKSPANKSEMVSCNNLNAKSFQELVLYYLQERKTEKNFELCHLIITNIHEWFVFDAQDFEKLFYQNKALLHRFEQFNEGKLSGTKTDFFYKEIAAPEIQRLQAEIPYAYFDIRDCDDKLLDLYKFLHPVYMLKLRVANDNNQLNKEFYAELLHIIGLEEKTADGRKLIVYKKANNAGSLIEAAMRQIESDECRVLGDPQYGESVEERAYNAAFRLAIIWINRILFLKLLEAQIRHAFLSADKLGNYGDLNELFFSVLAVKAEKRQEHLKAKFANVPYLNSSLFEQTDIERNAIYIRALGHIPHFSPYPKSVLKNDRPPKSHLEYLLHFLDAYDFSGEGSGDIREDSKPLISASVLGLIFEKINGYKDGSFFTPSFITMYMCREAIGRAVVQRFNEEKKWNCQSMDDLRNHIGKNTEEVKEANRIFNTVRICDPAVGSGHFLVSALNEMIYLKHRLEILADRDGKRLKSCNMEVSNDELAIVDGEGKGFAYNPKDSESQWVQEVLFDEKRAIIENCLFGVDVNPNSIEICRLRLWIELLKNAYYRDGGRGELETLPNIDINIKRGNSLVSRFDLLRKIDNAKLQELAEELTKQVLLYKNCIDKAAKKNIRERIEEIKMSISHYDSLREDEKFNFNVKQELRKLTEDHKRWVSLYKDCTEDREAKKVIRKNIAEIEERLTEIYIYKDINYSKWQEAKKKYNDYADSMRLGDDKIEWEKKLDVLEKEEVRLKRIYQEKITKFYSNAFEWSFKFPEVLDEDGNFVGFDIVIGNPPYISAPAMVESNPELRKAIIDSNRFATLCQKWDLYIPFMELGLQLLSKNGIFTMIVPYPMTNQIYAKKLRELIISQYNLMEIVDLNGTKVFENATVSNCIPIISKSNSREICYISHINEQKQIKRAFEQTYSNLVQDEKNSVWNLAQEKREANRHSEMNVLGDFCYISKGMVLNADEKTERGDFAKDDLISETYDAVHCRKYIEAKDIERYNVKRVRYLEYDTKRCPDKLSRPTFRELYEKPKLLHNSIGNLMVYFDKQQNFLHNHSLSCAVLWKDLKGIENKSILASVKRYSRHSRKEMELYSEQIDLRYLLGILNSKYAGVLLTNIRGGYINIYPEHLRNLPIPLADNNRQKPIINLVEKILSTKRENPEADTSDLEREIDALVYGLYGVEDWEVVGVEK